MLVQENFLKKLRSVFDLNIYEVKIWTALLSRGIATAGELSDISNVPRSRSYDVLESLEKKGFIIMKLGKPIRYLAVAPQEVLKRVKTSIENRAETKLANLEKVKTDQIFESLQSLHTQGIDHVDAFSLSGSFRGRNEVYNHLAALFANAEKSVHIVTTPEGAVRKLALLKNKFKKMLTKGVKITVYTTLSDEVKQAAKDFKGLTLKALTSIDSRFVLVDSKDVVFMVSDDKNIHESYDTGIWVNTPYFVHSLETMLKSLE